MSYSDPEEYRFLNRSQKGHSLNYAKQRPSKKHTRNDFYVTKTLYDPMNTVSKKHRTKILADKLDGFSFNVSYSMNKKERWEKIDRIALLKIRQSSDDALETIVVNRVDVPSSDDHRGKTVKSINLIQNDGIATLGCGGRPHTLSHFIGQIRDLKHMDKKEADPARMLFNFSSIRQSPAKRMKRKSKQKKRRAYQNVFDTDYEDYDTSETLECEPYASEEESAVNERDSSSCDNDSIKFKTTLPGPKPDEYLRVSIKHIIAGRKTVIWIVQPSATATASDASSAEKSIFEVIEIPLGSFKPFSVEILPFTRKGLRKKWLEPRRLFISSLEIPHPKFVIFFEEDKSQNILRVRVSTDSSYTKSASRTRLMDIVKTKKESDLSALFNDLYDFINDTTTDWIKDYCNSYDWDCRIKQYPEGFRCRVNSRLIAPMAASSFEFEQMSQLRQLYEQASPNVENPGFCSDSEFTAKCCFCRKKGKSDCFRLSTGMVCRECASISIIDQLERKKFPIDIPRISPSSALHFEVLYSVLPIPTVASLLKESLAFQAKPRFEMRFVTCPKCAMPYDCPMPLATTEDCVFNSCSCTKCFTAFCYLCEWEPHWPMSCEQFKKWTSRWDTQYFYENHHIDGEQLRLCCACEEFYSVGTTRYLLGFVYLLLLHFRPPFLQSHDHSHDSKFNWNDMAIKLRRHLTALKINVKNCKICLCAYARRQRFLQNSDFEKYVMTTFNAEKKEKFKNQRKTVLYLIEFCTGWLYVAKPFDWKHLSLQISNLNKSLQLLELQIPLARDDFMKHMGELEEETKNLIELVRKSLRQS
ncbi:unnamed protein product [Cylicocyclus nassatus]|uniref:Uncharacterized protein n=1 Tax=Cylicocyclus nassatus TaxID=53992 RepID=A0AA36H0P1_CYLNA|nr:unnamed protein product [Cylicocyclus nassatus]